MLRFCTRLFSIALVVTGLPACAPLVAIMGYGNTATQIAVQIDRFKLASDGLSYIKSGKTVTDHAVSKLVGADCHLMNVVSSEPVCTAKKDNAQVATRSDRITLAAVNEDALNRDAAYQDFPPAVAADDEAPDTPEAAITPALGSSPASRARRMRLKAPRGLKLPACCSSSSFSATGKDRPRSPAARRMTGV